MSIKLECESIRVDEGLGAYRVSRVGEQGIWLRLDELAVVYLLLKSLLEIEGFKIGLSQPVRFITHADGRREIIVGHGPKGERE